jgi:hypothetical protein
MNSDGNVLTNAQRQKLCEMMSEALSELRMLGWAGKSEQAGGLADAFHNLPIGIWPDDFSLSFFRNSFVGAYRESIHTRAIMRQWWTRSLRWEIELPALQASRDYKGDRFQGLRPWLSELPVLWT